MVSTRKKDQPYSSKLRGVAALLGEPVTEVASQSVAINLIEKPGQQPRRYFDPEKMEQLVSSVRQHGILEPILVRPLDSGRYELVAGERRYRAALEVGLVEVPVVIKELADEEAQQLTLIENLQRVDLNAIEETEGILQLLAFRLNKTLDEVASLLYRMQNEVKGKATQNVLGSSQEEAIKELFDSLGTITWESFVKSRLPLRKLPEEILEALRRGEIAYTKAIAISRVKDSQQRRELLAEAVQNNLSLAQIKVKVKSILPQPKSLPLKSRMQEAYRRLNSSQCWNNPKKQKKLEKLLGQIEAMVAED